MLLNKNIENTLNNIKSRTDHSVFFITLDDILNKIKNSKEMTSYCILT